MTYAELEVRGEIQKSDISTEAITELNESQLMLVGGGQGDIHLS